MKAKLLSSNFLLIIGGVLVLMCAAAVFVTSAKSTGAIPFLSSELGIAEYSPNGPSGGAVMPASGGSGCACGTRGRNAECAPCPPSPINGQCGSNNGALAYDGFSSSWCAVGSVSGSPSEPPLGGSVSWSCAGSNGGSDASCSATRDYPPPVVTLEACMDDDSECNTTLQINNLDKVKLNWTVVSTGESNSTYVDTCEPVTGHGLWTDQFAGLTRSAIPSAGTENDQAFIQIPSTGQNKQYTLRCRSIDNPSGNEPWVEAHVNLNNYSSFCEEGGISVSHSYIRSGDEVVVVATSSSNYSICEFRGGGITETITRDGDCGAPETWTFYPEFTSTYRFICSDEPFGGGSPEASTTANVIPTYIEN